MKSVAEISIHLANNIDRASILVEEILNNPFILALMAIESGIDTVANTLSSKRTLEVLKLFSTYADVDLTPIIKRKMSYWLVSNFTNYKYETEEAKVLYNDYLKLSKNLNLNTLSDYIAIYDNVNDLYQRFISLFNHNKLLSFKSGITAEDDYYLNYRLNDDYVCKMYLVDINMYDTSIHTEVHRDSVEREVIVDALEEEKNEIIKFRDEVVLTTKDLSFDKKSLRQKLFISLMYMLLSIASLCGGLLLGINNSDKMTMMINYILLILSSISIAFLFFCIVKYSKKLADCELVELATVNSDVSIEAICKEETFVLNPNNKKLKSYTLANKKTFSKNRRKDLAKIKKIACRKSSVSNGLLIISAAISLLPILEFGLVAVLGLFNLTPFTFYIANINISVISLGLVLVNFILLIIFRKKRFAYYLIYLYMILLVVLGFVIK
jgi:hypothetical protein